MKYFYEDNRIEIAVNGRVYSGKPRVFEPDSCLKFNSISRPSRLTSPTVTPQMTPAIAQPPKPVAVSVAEFKRAITFID